MPTIAQIRAARALLGWSQTDLADHAGLSQTGIARLENGTNSPNAATMEKINAAFDRADIEFLGDTGLRQRTGEVKTYRGQDGFRDFMDDVYETARDEGGEICLFNARPENWLNLLGQEWCLMHAERMVDIKDRYNFRTIAKQSDDALIGQRFIEYRWIPEGMFDERSFYCYGNKLAFLDFRENDIEIWVLDHQKFSEGFKTLFQISWDSVTTKAKIDPKKDIRNIKKDDEEE
ncbi:MAG: helix-turn-helix transcriptional regulator [Rhodospirillales bacterium]|nr:helix-turn-helix transcriptional regulator [Rhodospirillales bacterium]